MSATSPSSASRRSTSGSSVAAPFREDPCVAADVALELLFRFLSVRVSAADDGADRLVTRRGAMFPGESVRSTASIDSDPNIGTGGLRVEWREEKGLGVREGDENRDLCVGEGALLGTEGWRGS